MTKKLQKKLYEEAYLTDEEDNLLEELWEDLETDHDEPEEIEELEGKSLSIDIHGREHKSKGPGGGQFTKRKVVETGRDILRIGKYVLTRIDSITIDEPISIPKTTQPTETGNLPKDKKYIAVEEHKKAVKIAVEKLKKAPLPTKSEINAAIEGIKKKGANLFRKDLVGNTKNRRTRRNALLKEFGDGEHCPCIYCGLIVTHGTMEQDKIYTTLEGGRYRMSNLVPSCSDCNKKRSDIPFGEALEKVVNYVKEIPEGDKPNVSTAK